MARSKTPTHIIEFPLRATARDIRCVLRRLAARRQQAHETLANQLLAMSNTVHTEHLSYRAFQKLFGRSVGRRAPGVQICPLLPVKVSNGVTGVGTVAD